MRRAQRVRRVIPPTGRTQRQPSIGPDGTRTGSRRSAQAQRGHRGSARSRGRDRRSDASDARLLRVLRVLADRRGRRRHAADADHRLLPWRRLHRPPRGHAGRRRHSRLEVVEPEGCTDRIPRGPLRRSGRARRGDCRCADPDLRRSLPRAWHAGDGMADRAGQPPSAEGLQPHRGRGRDLRRIRPRAVSRGRGRRSGELNYVRGGGGDPLLLLHSLGGSLIQWSPVIDALAAERDVIAVDMPGFGESPELPDGVKPRAENLATAALDFCKSLGIDGKPAVAGISLGGWTAIECARQDGASAVVALCPAGFWKRSPASSNNSVARARRSGRAASALLRPIMATARGRRRALGRFIYHPERLSPGEAEAIARAYVTAPGYDEASALMRAGRVEDLKGIKTPITLAWAEHDTLVRNRPLRDGILPKRVEQVMLPGCGHVPTWDDPELVSRVILAGARRKR